MDQMLFRNSDAKIMKCAWFMCMIYAQDILKSNVYNFSDMVVR